MRVLSVVGNRPQFIKSGPLPVVGEPMVPPRIPSFFTMDPPSFEEPPGRRSRPPAATVTLYRRWEAN
jgi:hypothetical protein